MNWNAVAKARKTRPCKRATPSRVFIRPAPKTRAKRKPRAKARGLYGNYTRRGEQRMAMRMYRMLWRAYFLHIYYSSTVPRMEQVTAHCAVPLTLKNKETNNG